jgi:type II secretory pathway component PulK
MFTKPFPAKRRDRHAIALVLVLWAMFVLCLVVLGLAQRIDQEMLLAARDQRTLEARALAYSGLQIGLHPLSTFKTLALVRRIDDYHRYSVRILGEGGKINLNWLLVGEDARKLDLLKQYLQIRGLNFQERERFVDCLLDWIDPDNAAHLNGDETGLDGQPAPNRPFQDVAEIKRVRGSEPLTSQEHWEDDFSLLSKGPIDLQWASEEVIAALPRVGASRARGFVQQRRGEDKLDGTLDDRLFENPQMAFQMLGIGPQDSAAIQDLVTVKDSTLRIISVGQSGEVTKTLEVVVRKEGVPPQLLSWKEF